MRWTLPLLLLVAACSPRQATPPGSAATLVGTVASVDATPWTYDDDALVVVRTDAGETVTVRIPARQNLCVAESQVQLDALEAGDRIEARGAVDADGDVTPCTDADHFLRLVE